jgi:hypothetical protein
MKLISELLSLEEAAKRNFNLASTLRDQLQLSDPDSRVVAAWINDEMEHLPKLLAQKLATRFYTDIDELRDQWQKRYVENAVTEGAFSNNMTPWKVLNKIAKNIHGEFGFATLDFETAEDYVDMKKADALAQKNHADSFWGMDDREMEKFVNKHPELLKGKALKMVSLKEGAVKDAIVELQDVVRNEYSLDDDEMVERITDWIIVGEDDKKVTEFLYDFYSKNGEMPYGVQKARDGDPTSWLADHVSGVFSKQLKALGH